MKNHIENQDIPRTKAKIDFFHIKCVFHGEFLRTPQKHIKFHYNNESREFV